MGLKSKATDKLNSIVLQVAFADLSPYVLTTESSLADLNSKLIKKLPMENFRPNIVVDVPKAFEEVRLFRFYSTFENDYNFSQNSLYK